MSSETLKLDRWRVSLSELSHACGILSSYLHLRDEENRRVQWDLQPRVIRYYTTLGLLDRACEKRGRAVYYGCRHLFQLLGIKHLQAQGSSLAEIQSRLLGASNEAMLELLQLPSAWYELIEEHQLSTPLEVAEPIPDRNGDFWCEPPARYQRPEPQPETESLVRLRLPGGLEIVIPQELWQNTSPAEWARWIQQAPHA